MKDHKRQNLHRRRPPVRVPAFTVALLDPGFRFIQRHAGAHGQLRRVALHDRHHGFPLRGRGGGQGVLKGLEQRAHRAGNILGEVFPAVGHAPDGAKALLEKSGHDVGALAQQVFHVPFEVARDLLHSVFGFYGYHSNHFNFRGKTHPDSGHDF